MKSPQLSVKPKYKMWRVFDQPIGTFVYFFLCVVRISNKRLLRADPCCRSGIKEFAHAFSCTYIVHRIWMHLGSLESTQKAKVALGCASSYSYAFFVLSKLSACIHELSMNKFLISTWLNKHNFGKITVYQYTLWNSQGLDFSKPLQNVLSLGAVLREYRNL